MKLLPIDIIHVKDTLERGRGWAMVSQYMDGLVWTNVKNKVYFRVGSRIHNGISLNIISQIYEINF